MSKSKLLSLALCVILLLLSAFPAFADEATLESKRAILLGEPTELICVSKLGDTGRYPENSAEGVAAAFDQGADMVLIYLRKTSDGQIVLFSDENLKRMCADAQSNSIDKNINDVTFEELSTYFLRNGKGGEHEKLTAYSVSTFDETLKLLGGGKLLLIDGAWDFRDEVCEILEKNNAMLDAVILTDARKGAIKSWLGGRASSPIVFSKYVGTVIWSSKSYIRGSVNAGAAGVMLASGNPYSTTFSTSVVSKTRGKLRAMIDMTDKKLCGKRDDTATYWDDVTSRGFSVIVTDRVEELNLYKQRVELSRRNLSELIDRAKQLDDSTLSTYWANKLNSNILKATDALSYSVSALELDNFYNELNSVVVSLSDSNLRNRGTLTVSTGRIFAAALVIIAFVAFELYMERMRNKRIALRRKGIDKKGRYRLKNKGE